MRDPDKYRTIEVNKMMWRVMKGDVHVGQVRKGMDGLWYAELGVGDKTRAAAVQRVLLAHEAIGDMFRVVHG